jgi:cation-transporting ATPase E
MRTLLLTTTDHELEKEKLPEGLKAAAFILIEEKVRPDAAQTIQYFKEQQVEIKVISGDNPNTVGAVARRLGVPGSENPIDARGLPAKMEDLEPVVEEHAVFGRVVPEQKRMMVHALQADGHVVGMTGDGVNDTLALKDADLGIAMGSGAPSTKSVSEVVLVDGRFSTMPRLVAEGRRVVSNMERVSKLFINKTVYASLLAIGFAIFAKPFLFLPRQVTLVDALTIGIPGLILSFMPSSVRYQPGILRRILLFTIPAGIISAASTFSADALARLHGATLNETRTVSVIVLTLLGLGVLAFLAKAFISWWPALVIAMGACLVGIFFIPFLKNFLVLDLPDIFILTEAFAIAAIGLLLLQVVLHYIAKIQAAEKPRKGRRV